MGRLPAPQPKTAVPVARAFSGTLGKMVWLGEPRMFYYLIAEGASTHGEVLELIEEQSLWIFRLTIWMSISGRLVLVAFQRLISK